MASLQKPHSLYTGQFLQLPRNHSHTNQSDDTDSVACLGAEGDQDDNNDHDGKSGCEDPTHGSHEAHDAHGPHDLSDIGQHDGGASRWFEINGVLYHGPYSPDAAADADTANNAVSYDDLRESDMRSYLAQFCKEAPPYRRRASAPAPMHFVQGDNIQVQTGPGGRRLPMARPITTAGVAAIPVLANYSPRPRRRHSAPSVYSPVYPKTYHYPRPAVPLLRDCSYTPAPASRRRAPSGTGSVPRRSPTTYPNTTVPRRRAPKPVPPEPLQTTYWSTGGNSCTRKSPAKPARLMRPISYPNLRPLKATEKPSINLASPAQFRSKHQQDLAASLHYVESTGSAHYKKLNAERQEEWHQQQQAYLPPERVQELECIQLLERPSEQLASPGLALSNQSGRDTSRRRSMLGSQPSRLSMSGSAITETAPSSTPSGISIPTGRSTRASSVASLSRNTTLHSLTPASLHSHSENSRNDIDVLSLGRSALDSKGARNTDENIRVQPLTKSNRISSQRGASELPAYYQRDAILSNGWVGSPTRLCPSTRSPIGNHGRSPSRQPRPGRRNYSPTPTASSTPTSRTPLRNSRPSSRSGMILPLCPSDSSSRVSDISADSRQSKFGKANPRDTKLPSTPKLSSPPSSTLLRPSQSLHDRNGHKATTSSHYSMTPEEVVKALGVRTHRPQAWHTRRHPRNTPIPVT